MLKQTGTAPSTFGYTGEQTDPTDLVFLRARYYDPALGRFLTADSIIPDPLSSQGWNRYAYVENNPVNYVDPSGHCGVAALSMLRPDGPLNFAEKCYNAWNRTINAYQGGERRPWAIASHVYGVTDLLIEKSDELGQLNADADIVFSNACFEDRVMPSVRLGSWATKTSALIVGAGVGIRWGYRTGKEFPFGRNFRIAPFGNRTGHPTGRYPHYHRRGVDPITGQTYPGQGIGRHRPWDIKSTDTSFWDRF